MKTKKVQIDVHDVYQLMLAECRYGYTRNNHLMPGGAYDHVKKYLPKLAKADLDLGLHTACQLCEECISDQLIAHFSDGLDDEYNNRDEALKFIDWLLDFIHDKGRDTNYSNFMPYNYDALLANKEREAAHRYRVFELNSFEEGADIVKELTKEPASKKDADKILFIDELGVTSGVMNHIDIKSKDCPVRVVGEIVRIIEPETHKGKIYSIELVV